MGPINLVSFRLSMSNIKRVENVLKNDSNCTKLIYNSWIVILSLQLIVILSLQLIVILSLQLNDQNMSALAGPL